MKSGNTTIYASLKKRQSAGSGCSPVTREVQELQETCTPVQYEPGDLLWRATTGSSRSHTFKSLGCYHAVQKNSLMHLWLHLSLLCLHCRQYERVSCSTPATSFLLCSSYISRYWTILSFGEVWINGSLKPGQQDSIWMLGVSTTFFYLRWGRHLSDLISFGCKCT